MLLKIASLLVLVVAIIGSAAGYGYSRLQVTLEGTPSVAPEFSLSVQSVGEALRSAFTDRDLLDAVGAVIDGLRLSSDIGLTNDSPIPLYIPATTLTIYLNDGVVGRSIETDSLWLSPRAKETVGVDVVITLSELPDAALRVVADGGALDVRIDTVLRVGIVSTTYTTEYSTTIVGVLNRGLE